MTTHDKNEIKKLIKFKEQIKKQREETKNMTCEEKIQYFLKGLRGER